MVKKSLTTIMAVLMLLFTACNSDAQKTNDKVPGIAAKIEVIQFHSEHRCYSCLQIEKLTKLTLANYFPSLKLVLVNVDDKKNEKMAEEFEATGSALFLFNPATGKKKDLTSFAFLKVGNDKLFDTELKKHIEDFLKS